MAAHDLMHTLLEHEDPSQQPAALAEHPVDPQGRQDPDEGGGGVGGPSGGGGGPGGGSVGGGVDGH